MTGSIEMIELLSTRSIMVSSTTNQGNFPYQVADCLNITVRIYTVDDPKANITELKDLSIVETQSNEYFTMTITKYIYDVRSLPIEGTD